jgi:hypothetical protein
MDKMVLKICRLIDELAGEVPVAFVVVIQGSEISETEIKQFVAKEVIMSCPFSQIPNIQVIMSIITKDFMNNTASST